MEDNRQHAICTKGSRARALEAFSSAYRDGVLEDYSIYSKIIHFLGLLLKTNVSFGLG
jgi:hypothetical protein